MKKPDRKIELSGFNPENVIVRDLKTNKVLEYGRHYSVDPVRGTVTITGGWLWRLVPFLRPKRVCITYRYNGPSLVKGKRK